MAKQRQVLKMNVNGRDFCVVYRQDQKTNPYYIYRRTWVPSSYGLKERKTIEAKYADMRSCLFWLANAI